MQAVTKTLKIVFACLAVFMLLSASAPASTLRTFKDDSHARYSLSLRANENRVASVLYQYQRGALKCSVPNASGSLIGGAGTGKLTVSKGRFVSAASRRVEDTFESVFRIRGKLEGNVIRGKFFYSYSYRDAELKYKCWAGKNGTWVPFVARAG